MKEELEFENTDVGFELKERANPVFNTAKMTLFQLAESGDENAEAIAKRLGIDFDNSQNSSNTKIPREFAIINNLMLEMRYKTIGELALKSNCPIVLDLPCGYMPRGIDFIRKNIAYVGVDLPAAIEEGAPIISSLSDENKRYLLRFRSADATNYATLENALEGLEGKLCITTEGLLMYLTNSEIGVLCDNIAKLLRKHGGCWLNADIEASLQFILLAKPLFGQRFMEVMAEMKKMTAEKSDVAVASRSLVINAKEGAEGMKKAMAFLGNHGLKAERMIISEHMPKLNTLSKLNDSEAKAIVESMGKCAYWKITLLDEGDHIDSSIVKANKLKAKATLNEGVLTLEMHGRIDSMNAPDLLAFWEKISTEKSILSVTMDCKGVEYISSAGLRVLLAMYKGCKEGVKVSNANGEIREIFSMTGLDSLLLVEGD